MYQHGCPDFLANGDGDTAAEQMFSVMVDKQQCESSGGQFIDRVEGTDDDAFGEFEFYATIRAITILIAAVMSGYVLNHLTNDKGCGCGDATIAELGGPLKVFTRALIFLVATEVLAQVSCVHKCVEGNV